MPSPRRVDAVRAMAKMFLRIRRFLVMEWKTTSPAVSPAHVRPSWWVLSYGLVLNNLGALSRSEGCRNERGVQSLPMGGLGEPSGVGRGAVCLTARGNEAIPTGLPSPAGARVPCPGA